MFNIRKKVDLRIREYCFHELKQVHLKNMQGLFNWECHTNACQYALTHKGYKVVMGIYREKLSKNSSLHFWVRKDGVDYEVSTGYLCKTCFYYEIKTIDKEDYQYIKTIFAEGLDYYKEKLTTPFERIFVRGRIL